MNLSNRTQRDFHTISRVATTKNFITTTIKGYILIAFVIIVTISLCTTNALGIAISNQKRAIRHNVLVSEKWNSPGKDFLNLNINNNKEL